jgi:hypothetical protein
MSFFDPGNITYVDATLGWKFPTWDSLKALFSKYMPQWPAGARDGRHFGVSATESLRTSPAQFPADFGESRVGESATTRRLRMDEPGRLSPARRQRDQAQFPGTDRAADLDMGWLAGHTSMDNPAHVAHDRELEPRPEPGAVVPGV